MYNFETLSPKDFEVLTRDLLQEELNIRFESFKSGKDQGIDLRYSGTNEENIIVQCKHYKDSKFTNLIQSLKQELINLKKLQPQKYIVVTSLPLNPNEKDTIKTTCAPYILSTSDIYGKDDLNNLIQKHPEIERKHFKLWMTTTNILNQILHSDIVNESTFKLEEIKEKIKRFVPNPSLDKAKRTLQEENCVVISGAPGVGKTTLAEMLIWEYVINGYEFINISENINEAFSLYSPDINKKQIFYYDDFLGETHLTKNEDSRLILFINRINKSKNKKMILTTREYILQQTRLSYEKIDNFNFKKCIIDLKKYTGIIKAEILYSHLYFSELPKEYINAILENENYFKVINHKNYNPRIIEYMTKLKRHEYIHSKNYFEEFMNNLDNPSTIWNHAFENQLNNKTRSVLFAIATDEQVIFSLNSDINNLKKMAKNINKKLYSEDFTELDFQKSLKILDGDFLKMDDYFISFANPSIRDFLENYIYNKNLLPDFIELCETPKSAKWFKNTFVLNDKVAAGYKYDFFKKLNKINSFEHDNEITNLILETLININDKNLIPYIQEELEFIIHYEDIPYNVDILRQLRHPIFEDTDFIKSFIEEAINNTIMDIDLIDNADDYLEIAKFIDIYKDILTDEQRKRIINIIDKNFDKIMESALENNKDDIYDLEEISDKLYEIDYLLNMSHDFGPIDDWIHFLRQIEDEYKENYEEDNNTVYDIINKTLFINGKNEEREIKNLFSSLRDLQ